MTERLIDYAWQHPDPKAIKKAGVSGVLRYFSNDPSKDITAAEAKALHAAGLSVGVVWETTATEAAAGTAAGARDRAEAERRAEALGIPKNVPIFYAVDEDVAPAVVTPYFHGVHTGAKYPVGVYGSERVVEGVLAAGLATYAWQTEAWSGTAVSAKAHLYQRVHATISIAGAKGGWDENVVLKALPQWGATTAPAPKPAPKPVAKPAPKPPVAKPPAPKPVVKPIVPTPAVTPPVVVPASQPSWFVRFLQALSAFLIGWTKK